MNCHTCGVRLQANEPHSCGAEVSSPRHPKVQPDRDTGRKWTEPNRIISTLFGALMALLAWLGTSLWSRTTDLETRNSDHDVKLIKAETEVKANRELLENKLQNVEHEIKSQKEAVHDLDVRQQRMETKIDRIAERLK